MTRRFTDFGEGEAYLANEVQNFSDAQIQSRHNIDADDSHQISEPIDPSQELDWSPVWSLRDKRFKYFPDRPALFLPINRLPHDIERLRGGQHPRGGDRPGFPRTGRTRCLCDLVVQPPAPAGRGLERIR